MTQGLERLAQLAAAFAPPEAISSDEYGFTLGADDVELSFFAPGGDSGAAYFWRGTEGAVISLNLDENAIYLTDRFDEGAFEDDDAFRAYINDFLRTLFDWQERLESSLAEKEVAI